MKRLYAISDMSIHLVRDAVSREIERVKHLPVGEDVNDIRMSEKAAWLVELDLTMKYLENPVENAKT